jgi:hypothetical protein
VRESETTRAVPGSASRASALAGQLETAKRGFFDIMTSWSRKPALFNSFLMIGSGLATLFVVEVILTIAGLDTERRIQTAHPPNYHETRKHLEYEYVFSTNSLGLRSPEIRKDKPRGMFRILLAGDSFVEGVGVNADSTIAASLGRALCDSRLQVINGGLSGTGVFEHGRLVRHVGYDLALDGLLYFVFDNDVFDAQTSQQADDMSRKYYLKTRSGLKAAAHYLWPRVYTIASEAGTLVWPRPSRTDFVTSVVLEARSRGIAEERIEQWRAKILPEYATALENDTVARLIFATSLITPHFWSGSIDLDSPGMQEKFTKMTALLTANVADARTRGIQVGVVYIPSKFQYDPHAHAATEPWVFAGAYVRSDWLLEKTPIRGRLEAWASRTTVPYLDMTPYYRDAVGHGERLTWRLDEHFNARGNEYTATVIAKWLRRSGRFAFLGHPEVPTQDCR